MHCGTSMIRTPFKDWHVMQACNARPRKAEVAGLTVWEPLPKQWNRLTKAMILFTHMCVAHNCFCTKVMTLKALQVVLLILLLTCLTEKIHLIPLLSYTKCWELGLLWGQSVCYPILSHDAEWPCDPEAPRLLMLTALLHFLVCYVYHILPMVSFCMPSQAWFNGITV